MRAQITRKGAYTFRIVRFTLEKITFFRVLVLWTAILIIQVLLVAYHTRFSFCFLLILVVQLNP